MQYIKLFVLLIIFIWLIPNIASAHPMPNSVILMDIKENRIDLELQLPLNELELAFGHRVNQNSDGLVKRLGPELKAYLLAHIRPVGPDVLKRVPTICCFYSPHFCPQLYCTTAKSGLTLVVLNIV